MGFVQGSLYGGTKKKRKAEVMAGTIAKEGEAFA